LCLCERHPASYALLDALLLDLIASGFPEKIVDEILSRYYKSEYKRSQLPLGIKVSPKAFGMGRQMPITHAYRA
jgi:NAD+ synthase (glutamine-hydrolysing)